MKILRVVTTYRGKFNVKDPKKQKVWLKMAALQATSELPTVKATWRTRQ